MCVRVSHGQSWEVLKKEMDKDGEDIEGDVLSFIHP